MKKITVASYNVRHGADAGLDMSKLAKCIHEVGADIVGIQEMDVNTTRVNGRDLVSELKEASGFEYGDFVKCIDYKGGGYGTAIISKYPIVSFEKDMLYYTKGCEQRAVGVCRVDADGHAFTFANTHLDLVGDDVRRKQLSEIYAKLKGNEPYFLTGDFNTQNFSLFDEFPDGNIVVDENNKLVTFPSSKLSIDNIVYHKSVRLLSVGTNTESYSDHYLLYAVFEID